ncbi:hypothetical protein PQX77_006512 [Marasmius sp. AFHP31]|nr:hypothetical protein PQX77_006512 [Marasmius sp. AFHP31]
MVQAPNSDGTNAFSSSHHIGSLSTYTHYDSTVHIGTHFPQSGNNTLRLSEILTSPNSDTIIKDLATLVSHRGVVFLSNQDDLTISQQKELGERLGKLGGKPETSGLHRHPISEDTPELGGDVSVISSKEGITRAGVHSTQRASRGWHADITFEKVPSDYAILKMHTLPETGGDTLWASGYEAYDRLSPAFQRFLEGLTALHDGSKFAEYARIRGLKIQDPRGSPENTGSDLTAVHPVIRTHPLTGYKTLFVNRGFTKRILELTHDESEDVLGYLWKHVSENHDLQVRYRWNVNDVAIWDNRAVFHTATNDYDRDTQHRQGNRVVSIGEKPYFDPSARSRREDLGVPLSGRGVGA